MRDCFLYQHVSTPTRVRRNNEPHILNLVFPNEKTMRESNKHQSPLGKSDYEVLEIDFRCYAEKVKKESI